MIEILDEAEALVSYTAVNFSKIFTPTSLSSDVPPRQAPCNTDTILVTEKALKSDSESPIERSISTRSQSSDIPYGTLSTLAIGTPEPLPIREQEHDILDIVFEPSQREEENDVVAEKGDVLADDQEQKKRGMVINDKVDATAIVEGPITEEHVGLPTALLPYVDTDSSKLITGKSLEVFNNSIGLMPAADANPAAAQTNTIPQDEPQMSRDNPDDSRTVDVIQFMSITGGDGNEATKILKQHNWDLQVS